jgi:hypothetical protein
MSARKTAWSASVFRLRDADGRPEAALGQRRVPGERLVLRDQDVGVAVTVEIDETQIGIAPVDVGQERQRRKCLPPLILGTLEEAGQRPL